MAVPLGQPSAELQSEETLVVTYATATLEPGSIPGASTSLQPVFGVKLVPHPHERAAFGFSKAKPPDIKLPV